MPPDFYWDAASAHQVLPMWPFGNLPPGHWFSSLGTDLFWGLWQGGSGTVISGVDAWRSSGFLALQGVVASPLFMQAWLHGAEEIHEDACKNTCSEHI